VAQQIYIDVTVSQAKTMIDTNPSLVVLDVRNQSEYDAGHIRNAKLIPVWNLTKNLDKLNRSDGILVYCKAGSRSANASQILASNGFLHVYHMLAGIDTWTALAYPVYVNYSSPYTDFPPIQAAIDNATQGQTIYVGTGFYNERLFLNKSLTLVGENASTTKIQENVTVLNVNADNVSISDFTLNYVGCACYGYASINVTNSQNVNVTNNIIVSDDFGIRVAGSTNVIVGDNDFGPLRFRYSGEACIVVKDSNKVSVFRNDMTAMLGPLTLTRGIQIENSTESSFFSNAILSSETGIFIAQSQDDTFFSNNVSSTDSLALSITSSYNNSFFDNSFSTGSSYGLFFWQAFNNSLFDNNFPGNGSQILSYDTSTNLWDNDLEGNHWSNYGGVDANMDGIGDTPYLIDSNNRDNHPLMGPFQSFNTSLNLKVNIVSNSSIDEFQYDASNSTIMFLVSNTTTDQTVGFCRVRVPHGLINPYNGSISVVIDNGQTPVLLLNDTLYDDGTNRWIYFTYQLTTHSVSVTSTVPEFPIFIILTLFMILTSITTMMRKKRQARAFKNGRP